MAELFFTCSPANPESSGGRSNQTVPLHLSPKAANSTHIRSYSATPKQKSLNFTSPFIHHWLRHSRVCIFLVGCKEIQVCHSYLRLSRSFRSCDISVMVADRSLPVMVEINPCQRHPIVRRLDAIRRPTCLEYESLKKLSFQALRLQTRLATGTTQVLTFKWGRIMKEKFQLI